MKKESHSDIWPTSPTVTLLFATIYRPQSTVMCQHDDKIFIPF